MEFRLDRIESAQQYDIEGIARERDFVLGKVLDVVARLRRLPPEPDPLLSPTEGYRRDRVPLAGAQEEIEVCLSIRTVSDDRRQSHSPLDRPDQ